MTEENIEDKPVQMTMKIGHPKDHKDKIVMEMVGLGREITFDFTNEEDSETALRFGGALMNWFRDMAKLKAEVLDDESEDEEIQKSPDNPV